MACLLSMLFSFGVLDGKEEAEVLALPRATADELVLCSVFSFVTATDISVPYLSKIFCTDASLIKGAVCSRPVTEDTAVAMWLGGDKKGSYTKLDSNFRAAVKTLDFSFDENHEDPLDFGLHEGPWTSEPACHSFSPSASLDFSFDFVEICGGSGVVSKEAAKLGMTVSAPIELSDSEFFNIKDYRLCEWVSYMLIRGLFRSAMLQPPCTTYSPAAHPSVRSYSQPEGFNLLDPKTHEGNFVAYRCFILMLVAYHFSRPCMLEQPFLSKMAWLKIWKFLRRTVMSEAVVASCQFGSPHLKQFRLLCWGMDTEKITVRCPGGHQHVRIEGALTKPSAVYVPKLARHFAEAFRDALKKSEWSKEQDLRVSGLESVVANDVLLSGVWKIEHQWYWKKQSHINVLESNTYVSLLRSLVLDGQPGRFTTLLDSQVAQCSHAKGRSSAYSLASSLKKGAALSVAGGLYGAFGYAPTKLNVSDDPTRNEDYILSVVC